MNPNQNKIETYFLYTLLMIGRFKFFINKKKEIECSIWTSHIDAADLIQRITNGREQVDHRISIINVDGKNTIRIITKLFKLVKSPKDLVYSPTTQLKNLMSFIINSESLLKEKYKSVYPFKLDLDLFQSKVSGHYQYVTSGINSLRMVTKCNELTGINDF